MQLFMMFYFYLIILAVYSGHKKIVDLLLKNKAKVNVVAKNGKDALFYGIYASIIFYMD